MSIIWFNLTSLAIRISSMVLNRLDQFVAFYCVHIIYGMEFKCEKKNDFTNFIFFHLSRYFNTLDIRVFKLVKEMCAIFISNFSAPTKIKKANSSILAKLSYDFSGGFREDWS